MIDRDGFRTWIAENTNYDREKSVNDVVNRMSRADRILEWHDDDADMYMYRLEKEELFSGITATVKSQLRHAVRMYKEYIESI